MSEARPFQAIVEQILAGKAPRQVRLAASRGALPLPRPTLVRLYLALREDEDDEIRAAASGSLDGLDRPVILEVLGDETCAPPVLDFFAAQAVRDEELAEQIAFHPHVPLAALAKLAGKGSGNVIELVLTNQQRLLAQPELLDRLSVNPALRADQRGRILELLDRASRAKTDRDDSTTATDDAGEVSGEMQEAARLLEIDVGQLFAASEIIDGEEFEQSEDPEIRTVYAKIMTLNTAQKAILAMRGGREERMILIRDSNQVVSLAVLKNGRITEDDIERMARMRNVSAEVLRQIGQNRDWAKNYTVVTALVTNPRTPPGCSTNFISRLRNQDLKKLVASHDVPELIRRMAKRALYTRTQKSRSVFKK